MQDRVQSVAQEKVVLVRVILAEQTVEQDPLAELEGLATTAGSEVVGLLTQHREVPSIATYLGSGKVEELASLVERTDADAILFDNDLSPAQARNLEKATKVKVLDRTELILDIFATNAQTYESRLAVELAQLEYSLPRLKRMWTHLSRLKMGLGMRGPGEKQLETDRRLAQKRINDLKKDLNAIERRKERQVAGRRGYMTVSLVGYTNAGKSTLMNRLTEADVLAEDKLFATLDTRTRRWQLPSWGPVLLSDTVGFIRDLPHRLIASFKATLEETRQADLLLHVADASSPSVLQQINSVYEVLEELGFEAKDMLLAVNKTDAADEGVVAVILNRYPNAVAISAYTGAGLEDLAHAVSDALSQGFLDLDVETGVENGKLQAYCAANGEVLSKRFDGDRVIIHCRMPRKYAGRISAEEADVREHVTVSDSADETSGADRIDEVA